MFIPNTRRPKYTQLFGGTTYKLTIELPTLLGLAAAVTEQVAQHVGHPRADEWHVKHRANPNSMAATFPATTIVISS